MVQLESNKPKDEHVIEPPRRRFTMEFFVGVFTLVGVACGGLLAVGLGKQAVFGGGETIIYAKFYNISGLEKGASVEIAGVPIGEVADITLDDPRALVALRLNQGVQIRDDDIAMIRTKGIIGDRYVKISRGGSDTIVEPGKTMPETESVVDIEDIIGKLVHSFTGDKDKDDKKEDKK